MADIYLHSINEQDLALFNQFVARKLLFEQGIVPPKQIVSQHRNEMLRSYIKSIADNERTTTAGFHIEATEQAGYRRLLTTLANKKIATWALNVALENKILLIVSREDAAEVQASVTNLVQQGILIKGEQEY